MTSESARLEAAVASIADRLGPPVEIALILGTGLGGLAAEVGEARAVSYAGIEGFPVSTAPGHAGRMVTGTLHGRRVVLMEGRLHLYEGWTPGDIALAVRLLRRLGAQRLVITNAAGALNSEFEPGDVMLIEDHLNFTGASPLRGPNDETIGERFPDMSRAYDPALRAAARRAAEEAGVALRYGIYAGVAGPQLETSAERRFLRAAGGDAVGMSTVLEVIAAVHAGLPVLGLSAIANGADGGPDQKPDTIAEVLANAERAGVRIAALLRRLLPMI